MKTSTEFNDLNLYFYVVYLNIYLKIYYVVYLNVLLIKNTNTFMLFKLKTNFAR